MVLKASRKMFKAENTDPNMTDVNGAGGAMDEDGEYDSAEADVNEAPEGDGDEEDEVLATSVRVESLVVRSQYHPGEPRSTIIVTADVHTATGIHKKHLSFPGPITVAKLADMLKGSRW